MFRACAVQEKVWVDGPGGGTWEVHTVLADAPAEQAAGPAESGCCA